MIGVVEEVGAEVTLVPARRLRDRAVLPLRQHLPELPGRDAPRPASTSASPPGDRGSTPGSPRPRAAWCSAHPGDGMPDAAHAARAAHPLRRVPDRLALRRRRRREARRHRRGRRRRRRRAVRRARRGRRWAPSGSSRCRGTSERQEIARQFGATHIVAERGKEGAARIKELTDGVGADAVLECVGTDGSMRQAFACARPGSTVGFVGVPHGVELPVRRMFGKNIGLAGGVAPVRTLPARAARAGHLRCRRPRAGLRHAAAARRGRRGLPRDGRAARHQGLPRCLTQ